MLQGMTAAGDVKRRTREQTRRFERLKEIRSSIPWELTLNRDVFDEWEDLAADSDDEELARAVIWCLEVLKATIRERDAVKSMQRRQENLGGF